MKLLTASEMKAVDRATFENVGVPPIAVMESAGRACLGLLLDKCTESVARGCVVVTGSGNNAGDGFVLARGLRNLGVAVTLLALKSEQQLSGEAKEHAKYWKKSGGEIHVVDGSSAELRALEDTGVIVDAIFGTGIRGAVSGAAADVILRINEVSKKRGIPVLAIDLPSGVIADSGAVEGPAVQATLTAVIQCPKLGHVMFPGCQLCGEVWVLDAGIDVRGAVMAQVTRSFVTLEKVRSSLDLFFRSQPEHHKGGKGHVLVIGGSGGHYGAPKLAAEAALRLGAGLVTLALPERAANQVAPELKELMCAALAEDSQGNFSGCDSGQAKAALVELVQGKKALVLGPGIGQSTGAAKLVREVLECAGETSLVIDADALNIIAAHPELKALLGPRMVLTPHPGEMSRLTGNSPQQIQSQRLTVAAEFSAAHNCWLVLKGARTVISGPDGQQMVNPAATDVLATAGSGDVLSGMIAACLGRGMGLKEAAECGVFLHGVAGEVLEKSKGTSGVLAGDIINTAPEVLKQIMKADLPNASLSRKLLPGSVSDDLLQAVVREYAHSS